MFPYIGIFGRDIGLYSLMALCGILSAGVYASLTANSFKYDNIKIIIFLLIISTGVIAGSHIFYALVNYSNIIFIFQNLNKINTIEKIYNVLSSSLGGSVFYGGLIGGMIVACLCIKKNKEYIPFIDIITVSIPLFHFFGRLGCFLGGCCYGIPSNIGFTYQNSLIEEANGIIRFPVQIAESLFNIILFFLLNYFLKRKMFKNLLLYIYLLVYSIGRFFIEFLRGDLYRGMWLFLSTSQIISILFFFIALFILIRKYVLYKGMLNRQIKFCLNIFRT